jgi:hypothetical protein
MMIIWWSKHVGAILSVLVCDIWINVLLQTSALVGPLYIANWNARWNSEIQGVRLSEQPVSPYSNSNSIHRLINTTPHFLNTTFRKLQLSSSGEQTVSDKSCTYILNSLITFTHKICANFASPDEENSSFRNVVIIQFGVVFVTLWEKVLLFNRDVLQVAAVSRSSMVQQL